MTWNDIARSSRWRPLVELVERFYASPLSPDDGHTPEEVGAVAARLGRPLPVALGEWYQLVGKRLEPIQDHAVRLDELANVGGRVVVWRENQGTWRIDAPLGAEDDPPVDVLDANVAGQTRLSVALTGMVVSETLIGAWANGDEGGLGAFLPAVTGGFFSDGLVPDAVLARVEATFAPLSWFQNPLYDQPYRGDRDLLVRVNGSFLEWMASSDEALGRLDAVVPLEPPGGSYALHVVFRGLDDEQLRFFTSGPHGYPDTNALQAALGKAGHLASLGAGRKGVVARIETREPRAAWAAIAKALPPGAIDCAQVAHAPEAMTRFTILHPIGLTRFVVR